MLNNLQKNKIKNTLYKISKNVNSLILANLDK